LVGKNSSVASVPKTVTCCNDRYAARVASAEKAHIHTDILAVSTNIRAHHGISDVVDKIVFDCDGGKSAELVPMIAELVAGEEEESNTGKEDDNDSDNSSGSSGSSGGGARMRRDRTVRDAAEALVTLPVPEVIVEVGTDERSSVMLDTPGEVSFFSCCVDRYCLVVDDQTSPRQVWINCNCVAHLACSNVLVIQNPVEMEFALSIRDFTKTAKSRIRVIPKSQHGTIHFCILCKVNLKVKAIKVKSMAKKLPYSPRKNPCIAKFLHKILAELRQIAAFHCQAFVFLQCEKTSQMGMYAMMEEQYYGRGGIHKKVSALEKKAKKVPRVFFRNWCSRTKTKVRSGCRRSPLSPPPRQFCRFPSHRKSSPLASNARHLHVTRAILASQSHGGITHACNCEAGITFCAFP
jgi:hypothetical protein